MNDRDIFLRDVPEDVREDLAFSRWQENERMVTHAEGCHTWGSAHYECALRRIAELGAKLADAKKDKWIPVSERLPDDRNSYLVYLVNVATNEPYITQSRLNPAKTGFYVEYDKRTDKPLETVTHWMALLKPPLTGGAT